MLGMCSMVIIHPADKDTAMDTDVTAITAVMESHYGSYGKYGDLRSLWQDGKRFDGQVWRVIKDRGTQTR